MKILVKYYLCPLLLTVATLGYFAPFFLPVTPGGFTGQIVANCILLFVVCGLCAWLVAAIQIVLGIIGLRKQTPLWKHHLFSAAWTFVCYLITAVLFAKGFVLTA